MGSKEEVLSSKTNFYQCKTEDFQKTLICEISSGEEEYLGTCVLRYGPIRLSGMTKKALEEALEKRAF